MDTNERTGEEQKELDRRIGLVSRAAHDVATGDAFRRVMAEALQRLSYAVDRVEVDHIAMDQLERELLTSMSYVLREMGR